jgi:hypothetical protein
VAKYDKYFRRKGWFGLSPDAEAEDEGELCSTSSSEVSPKTPEFGGTTRDYSLARTREMAEEIVPGSESSTWSMEDGKRIIIEAATAYAIVKAALPLRLGLSLYLTPWFARVAVSRVASKLDKFSTKMATYWKGWRQRRSGQ